MGSRLAGFCLVVFLLVPLLSAQIQPVQIVATPFDLYRKYLIVVHGSLGGLEKRNLIIDTGANPSVIDESIARKLHLSGSKEQLRLVNHDIRSPVVLLPEITFGQLARHNVAVAVQDLSRLGHDLNLRVDGLIGLDILGQTSFRIDYARKLIVFGPVDMAGYVLPFRTDPPFVTVQIEMEEQPVSLSIDTGAFALILFQTHVRNLLANLQPGGESRLANLTGQFSMQQVRLSRLRLADNDLGSRMALLAADQAASEVDFDGLMGITSLGLRQIAFDFERRLFLWQGQDSGIPTAMPDAKSIPCRSVPISGAMFRGRAGEC